MQLPGFIIAYDIIAQIFQFLGQFNNNLIKFLQGFGLAKCISNGLIIVMGSHGLLKQIDDIYKNQDEESARKG